MGWNVGWSMMQDQVISIYDLLGENFTPDVCKAILMPYTGTDYDSGGKDYNKRSKDGKTEEQIVVETLDKNFDPATYETEAWDWDDVAEDEKISYAYRVRFDDLMDELWRTATNT